MELLWLPTNKLILVNFLFLFPQHLLSSACWLELSKPSKGLTLIKAVFEIWYLTEALQFLYLVFEYLYAQFVLFQFEDEILTMLTEINKER